VILPRDRWAAWLDPARTEPADIAKVLSGIEIAGLSIREVSTDVNRVSNNGPHLIDPLPRQGDRRLDLTMTLAA
jgi:putative SOS response-associated peptidase YedK